MSFEEKSAWFMGLTFIICYFGYAIVVLGRAAGVPLPDVHYVTPLLWSMGTFIAFNIVGHIAIAITNPREAGQRDERDKQIHRFSEYIGHSFVIVGGVAALVFSMLELRHFWIANVLYLCFMLSGLLSAIAKILAYRKGFQ